MWVDRSSWGQMDNDRTPKTWELQVLWDDVIVTRWIYGEPGRWYVNCESVGLRNRVLISGDIEEAKKEAVYLVLRRLKAWESKLREVAGLIS